MATQITFTKRERQNLLLKMASRPEGATAPDVYQAALQAGDTVTPEAYQNLARRLVHRGVLIADDGSSPITYRLGQAVDSSWLDEEELAGMVSDEYPLLALPIWKESLRQIRQVPEDWWALIRAKLMQEPAREIFERAITSYCQDLKDAIDNLVDLEKSGAATDLASSRELARLREEARNDLLLLQGLVRFGLGISSDAIRLPGAIEEAVAAAQTTAVPAQRGPHPVSWDPAVLRKELERRISDETFIVVDDSSGGEYLVAAVDGSTRSGVMSFLGEEDDFYVGHAPMVSINTAVGQVNRRVKLGADEFPVFLRLPEKPEDMQQRDNKYTVMAKLYYPDLSDAEYMHSLWNAMDVLEARTTLKIMSPWQTSQLGVEVPPSDVVLRDGTVVPQDRDFSHYRDCNRYGEIVRDMVATNWEIAKKCKSDSQTVAGVVKSAHLRVFGPVLNWYVKDLAARKQVAPVEGWPMDSMNILPDQILITRLLTARRGQGDPWTRTCFVLRPFHATTNFSKGYSTHRDPIDLIEAMRKRDLAAFASGEQVENIGFWQNYYRGNGDSYLQMLRHVWYGSCFIATVPRLDFERYLPRMEFMVPADTFTSTSDPIAIGHEHLKRLCAALHQTGFEVSAEHSMFGDKSTLEVLPELVVRAHDTVKTWARELLVRVDEYLSAIIGRYIAAKRARGIRVRPFTKQELKMLHDALEAERKRLGGAAPGARLKS
jgi:hypothetical protein